MEPGTPSRTAFGAARHRAVHQVVEGGRIFADPLAVPILGHPAGRLAAWAADHPDRRPLRVFIACRHRLADDVVAARAVALGPGLQVVVLGAGLDTTAYRPRSAELGLRVFEVDHPDTQAWKLDVVRRAGLSPTVPVEHVGVDFERWSFLDALDERGLRRDAPTVVAWLGVVPYLTASAVGHTLTALGELPAVDLVADYPAGPSDRRRDDLARRVDSAGEPFRSRFTVALMSELCEAAGLRVVEDLGVADVRSRVLGRPVGPPCPAGGRLMHAVTG